jgi:hypothetical protein
MLGKTFTRTSIHLCFPITLTNYEHGYVFAPGRVLKDFLISFSETQIYIFKLIFYVVDFTWTLYTIFVADLETF